MNLWEAIKVRIAKLFERESLFPLLCIIAATVALFTGTDGMDAETWAYACTTLCGISTGGLVARKFGKSDQPPAHPAPPAPGA